MQALLKKEEKLLIETMKFNHFWDKKIWIVIFFENGIKHTKATWIANFWKTASSNKFSTEKAQ